MDPFERLSKLGSVSGLICLCLASHACSAWPAKISPRSLSVFSGFTFVGSGPYKANAWRFWRRRHQARDTGTAAAGSSADWHPICFPPSGRSGHGEIGNSRSPSEAEVCGNHRRSSAEVEPGFYVSLHRRATVGHSNQRRRTRRRAL
jgi:hypothetical protein